MRDWLVFRRNELPPFSHIFVRREDDMFESCVKYKIVLVIEVCMYFHNMNTRRIASLCNFLVDR